MKQRTPFPVCCRSAGCTLPMYFAWDSRRLRPLASVP